MMKKQVKISAVLGISLFILAALFSISLLCVVLDYGTMSPVHNSAFLRFGKMISDVYGYTSILIPLFLLVCGIECFVSNWNLRKAFIILGSVIPFFTIYFCEQYIRKLLVSADENESTVKIFGALVVGFLLVLGEIVFLALIGGLFEEKDKKLKPKNEGDVHQEIAQKDIFEEETVDDVPYDAEIEQKDENAESEKEDFVEPQVDEKSFEEPVFEDDTIVDNEPNPFDHVFDDVENSSMQEAEIQEESQDAQETQEEQEVQEKSNDTSDTIETIETNDSIVTNDEDFEEPQIDENYDEQIKNSIEEEENNVETSETFEEEANEISDADIDFDPEEFEKEFGEQEEEKSDETINDELDDKIFDENLDLNFEDEDGDLSEGLEDEFLDVDGDEDDIISEFENDAANVTEKLDNTYEVDISEFGIKDEENESIEDIFAQMDKDAAENPNVDDISAFDDNISFEDPAVREGVSQDLPEDIFDEELKESVNNDANEQESLKEVDAEYVDTSISLDNDEIRLEDIPVELQNAIKQSHSFKKSTLEQTVFRPQDEDKKEQDIKKTPEKPKPKLRLSNYKIPTDLLTSYANDEYWVIDEKTNKKADDLKQTFSEFNIDVQVTGIRKGPVVTMFEVLPAPGVNVNKIRSLQENIALRLAATSVRIVAPIPGKRAVGIEIPNEERSIVSFREIMEQKNLAFEKMAIPVILGKDISGEPQLIDLAKTPHLLIAGSTGSGKSVCVNSLILSILYKRSPAQVKMILIDPKVVELKLYNDIPHLLTPVITEPKKALQSLQYCLCEMERRYALLDGMGVRDISNYNKRIVERHIATEKLPYIVVIIDEFADLMATTGRELESNVARLCAMSRAVGIHLVLATQRPSVNVITGLIKANIPSRIAFMVASRTDSNIIIDQIGAEKLLGKGDMLYASATDPFPMRIQGTLVIDDEVEHVVEYVKQYGEPDYIDDEIFVDDEEIDDSMNPGLFSDGADPLYDQALQIVVQAGKASASYIQRRLKIGYNRAARLVEEMEERGIVGPQNGSKPREVIHAPE